MSQRPIPLAPPTAASSTGSALTAAGLPDAKAEEVRLGRDDHRRRRGIWGRCRSRSYWAARTPPEHRQPRTTVTETAPSDEPHEEPTEEPTAAGFTHEVRL